MGWLALLAQTRTEPFLRKQEDWVVVGMLAGVLLGGALLVHLVDRWRKRNEREAGPNASELTGFRGMYERGEITEEEYAKLRERVAQRVKAPPKPAAGPNTPSGPVPDPGPRLNLPGLIDWETVDADDHQSQQKLPGPETPTPPPESGKPANPPPPA